MSSVTCICQFHTHRHVNSMLYNDGKFLIGLRDDMCRKRTVVEEKTKLCSIAITSCPRGASFAIAQPRPPAMYLH